jgi:hypothetical protein
MWTPYFTANAELWHPYGPRRRNGLLARRTFAACRGNCAAVLRGANRQVGRYLRLGVAACRRQ